MDERDERGDLLQEGIGITSPPYRKRLDEFVRDGDTIGRQRVTLQSERLERKIDLEDRLESLTL